MMGKKEIADWVKSKESGAMLPSSVVNKRSQIKRKEE
jgi:hypothetical protein